MTAIKAAVRKADWERFKIDGGALVVYPVKKGAEIAGMIRITMEAIWDAAPVNIAGGPKRRKTALLGPDGPKRRTIIKGSI